MGAEQGDNVMGVGRQTNRIEPDKTGAGQVFEVMLDKENIPQALGVPEEVARALGDESFKFAHKEGTIKLDEVMAKLSTGADRKAPGTLMFIGFIVGCMRSFREAPAMGAMAMPASLVKQMMKELMEQQKKMKEQGQGEGEGI